MVVWTLLVLVMHDDTVIRSLVLESGILNAHASGRLRWWPRNGVPREMQLTAPATVLLGLKGPQGTVWRVAVGDEAGGIRRISLPDLVPVDHWIGDGHGISALAAWRDAAGRRHLICGDGLGRVRTLESGGRGELFEVGEAITGLRVDRGRVVVSRGWRRSVHDWTGSIVPAASFAGRPSTGGRRWVQTALPV